MREAVSVRSKRLAARTGGSRPISFVIDACCVTGIHLELAGCSSHAGVDAAAAAQAAGTQCGRERPCAVCSFGPSVCVYVGVCKARTCVRIPCGLRVGSRHPALLEQHFSNCWSRGRAVQAGPCRRGHVGGARDGVSCLSAGVLLCVACMQFGAVHYLVQMSHWHRAIQRAHTQRCCMVSGQRRHQCVAPARTQRMRRLILAAGSQSVTASVPLTAWERRTSGWHCASRVRAWRQWRQWRPSLPRRPSECPPRSLRLPELCPPPPVAPLQQSM